MLTNNKKFVRGIAMLLALLMVTALCLTGCGNKTADEALTKAEEAKTAVDAVTAALDKYVAKDDKATVKALVIEALGDDYATAAELDALAAKLADYVTADNIAKMIKDEMAKYALDKLDGELMTKDDVLKILEDYYTKDEIDQKFENILGEFSAEEVQAILKDAMSLKEWDDTTDVVLSTIEYLQVLLKSLETETYTRANMAKVNECLAPFGIVAFKDGPDADNRLDELKGDTAAIAEIAKALEYTILRQATLEDMAELKAAVDAAVAVPTFEKSFKALKADLYGLGDLYVVGNYDANGKFVAQKYGTDSYYHETAVAGNSEKKVQIVTLADKAGYHEFANAHDALLAEYYADNTHADGSDGWITGLTVYKLYEITNTNSYGEVVSKVLTTALTNATAPANSRLVGMTMLSTAVAKENAYLEKVYQNKLAENEVLLFPLYETKGYVTDFSGTQGAVTTDYKKTGTFEKVVNDFAGTQSGDNTWQTAYSLVWTELTYVQMVADKANDMFQGDVTTIITDTPWPVVADMSAYAFLKDVIYANTASLRAKRYENVTDPEFLDALTASMCEPDGVNVYQLYLLDNIDPMVKEFLTANGKQYDPTVGGFEKWDLYEKMMDKSFDLLWNKYKKQAADWANIILKDYISVAYEAKVNTPGNVTGNAAITVHYTDKADLVTAMNNLTTDGLTSGETVTAAELTDGFLSAFLIGGEKDPLTGEKQPLTSDMYVKLDQKDKFINSNLLAFYLNNGEAMVSTTKVGNTTPSYGLVYANPLASINQNAENIRQRLTGSMIYTELEIARADMETYKATGVSVREAFYPLLKEGIENLDEIYARFLFEDYKKMTYNEMAVKAEKIVTFYNKGTANAAQTAAVERYLTGVATATNSTAMYEIGMSIARNSQNNQITSITYKANDMESSLTNGFLVTNVAPIVVNLWATSSGSGTEKVAAVGMEKVDAFAAEATTNIENMLIKNLFLNYLYEARGNLAAANVTYDNYRNTIDVTTWETSIKLMEANNTADDQITVVEFFHNRNDYKLADYKDSYINEVLKLVADRDNLHVLLLSGKSIDEIVDMDLATQTAKAEETFKNELKNVKSSLSKTWVIGKYSPYTNADDYYYIGEYAVDLDKIMNTMPGRETQYKDDAGTHYLY